MAHCGLLPQDVVPGKQLSEPESVHAAPLRRLPGLMAACSPVRAAGRHLLARGQRARLVRIDRWRSGRPVHLQVQAAACRARPAAGEASAPAARVAHAEALGDSHRRQLRRPPGPTDRLLHARARALDSLPLVLADWCGTHVGGAHACASRGAHAVLADGWDALYARRAAEGVLFSRCVCQCPLSVSLCRYSVPTLAAVVRNDLFNSWVKSHDYCVLSVDRAPDQTYVDAPGGQEDWVCMPPSNMYAACIYWSIATTTSIGYGDISATHGNASEQWVAALLMFATSVWVRCPSSCVGARVPCRRVPCRRAPCGRVPCGRVPCTTPPGAPPPCWPRGLTDVRSTRDCQWGRVIATFCEVLSTMNPALTDFRITMDNLNRFVAVHNLPGPFRVRLRDYFHRTQHLQRTTAYRSVLLRMSPSLQLELLWHTNRRWLQRVPWLQEAEPGFVTQLVLSLKPMVFAPSELATGNMLYIVWRGVAMYGGRMLKSGGVWGDDVSLL